MSSMQTSALKQNGFLRSIQNFIYSDIYVGLLACFAVIVYIFPALQLFGILTFVIIGTAIFILQRDMTPIFPLLFFVTFLFSDIEVFSNPKYFIVFAPALIGFIIHLIRFPVKNAKMGIYGVALLVTFASLLLGGIFTDEYEVFFDPTKSWFGEGLAQIAALGIGMPVIYFVFKHYICPNGNIKYFNVKHYFALTIMCVGLIVGFQMLYLRIITGSEEFNFGWGNINFAGYVFLLAIPCTYYLMAKTDRIFTFFMFLIFLHCMLILSISDGGLAIILLFSPVLVVYTYKKISIKNQFKFKFILAILVLCIAALFLYKATGEAKDANTSLLDFFYKHFFNDTGRTKLYLEALSLFKENPLFGKGTLYPIIHPFDRMNNYHSSIFHTLATMGSFGIIAYALNVFSRFYILTRKNSTFNIFMYMTVACYMSYALIDCGEFTITMLYIVSILTITEYTNSLPEKQFVSPLEKYKLHLGKLKK